MKLIQLKSTITCPECGYTKEETMPEDACTFFYGCEVTPSHYPVPIIIREIGLSICSECTSFGVKSFKELKRILKDENSYL